MFVVDSLQNYLQVGKKVADGESGKQDELKREQQRRKSDPIAAGKRPKSTERHVSDA